ncbi:hypothetical protein PIU50_003348 [Clostridioides difficile]|nr:hypothetical protein [Clostridioides difficile]MBZ0658226.1 hypothetical protein [Clostridioides difficile]HBF9359973.1 hypothetical protein [Clostridioides difficile]
MRTLIVKELKSNLKDFYYEYSLKININIIHKLNEIDEERELLESTKI